MSDWLNLNATSLRPVQIIKHKHAYQTQLAGTKDTKCLILVPPECILSGPDTVNLSSTYYNTGQRQSHDTLTSIVICTTKIHCYRLSFDSDLTQIYCILALHITVLVSVSVTWLCQYYRLSFIFCVCVCVCACVWVHACMYVHVCRSPSPLKSAVQSVMVATLWKCTCDPLGFQHPSLQTNLPSPTPWTLQYNQYCRSLNAHQTMSGHATKEHSLPGHDQGGFHQPRAARMPGKCCCKRFRPLSVCPLLREWCWWSIMYQTPLLPGSQNESTCWALHVRLPAVGYRGGGRVVCAAYRVLRVLPQGDQQLVGVVSGHERPKYILHTHTASQCTWCMLMFLHGHERPKYILHTHTASQCTWCMLMFLHGHERPKYILHTHTHTQSKSMYMMHVNVSAWTWTTQIHTAHTHSKSMYMMHVNVSAWTWTTQIHTAHTHSIHTSMYMMHVNVSAWTWMTTHTHTYTHTDSLWGKFTHVLHINTQLILQMLSPGTICISPGTI